MTTKIAKDMEPKDEKIPVLPEGFEHVQERLNETTDRLKQIDQQIKNTPKEKGPTPQYNPPDFVGLVVPGSHDKTRIALLKKQRELKMETLSKTEADTREADGKAGRIVRDAVREKLFPNPYRQLGQQAILADKGAKKEIEQSQDYMDAQLAERAAAREKEKQEQKQPPQTQDKNGLSMSARFSQSLSYTKAAEKVNASPSQTRDRQVDKDRD